MNLDYLDKEMLKWHEELKANKEARQKLIELAEQLKLPITYTSNNQPAITMSDLQEILFNDKKLQELISRIRLKSFW